MLSRPYKAKGANADDTSERYEDGDIEKAIELSLQEDAQSQQQIEEMRTI
jgi:hypothetical protein